MSERSRSSCSRGSVSRTHIDDVARRKCGFKARLETYTREALPGGDCDGHSAKHAAQRGLGSVEITMRVDEYHAYAQGLCGGTGMLQTAEHAKNSVAVREEADGQVTAAAFFGNQFGEIAAGQREFVPGAVSLFLVGSQRRGRNWLRLDALILEQLLDSALLQIIWATRSIGHIPLAHVGHLDERHANWISMAVFSLSKRDCQQQQQKTKSQQRHAAFHHCHFCDLRAPKLHHKDRAQLTPG